MENVEIFTYKVIKGKFKGKVVKSFESRHYIFGFGSPYIPCFDEDGNEYIISFDNLTDYKGE